METIYLILVIVLFALAISDLIVGVSNDAVNFLNSAIGSKVAPLKVIMIIAALGIIIGATFSSGMMEVARKGIFHPQYFYFSEIIIIFLAVMITDVILLDTFNTFGMPTSTTVSIVFELLGAAVAISIIKRYTDPNAMEFSEYINSAKALAIISGILLSVVIAFTVGVIVQFFARLLFSFNYKRNLKYFGAIWGGIAITAITYFILIKGAKGAAFMSDETKDFIKQNSFMIITSSFIFWTIILQLFSWLTKINILKFIVLVGTFALAMAFAGNDLVNFIGVPLAGFESFKSFIANPGMEPDTFLMTDLTGKVKTPTFFLLIAGIIMVVTLWTSKKARSVTKTEINLARQDVGYERFGSSLFARSLVRSTNNMSKNFKSIIPGSLLNKIEKRFDQKQYLEQQNALGKKAPYFDSIRASVNLVVASILIAFATSLKLPLSTTYVTFMVAMGTSLSDRAWGRESAVYRVTGVFSVIGGWFFTAFSAFTVAFIIAMIISWGGFISVIILVALAVFFVYRTHIIHRRRAKSDDVKETAEEVMTGSKIANKCSVNVTHILNKVSEIYDSTLEGLTKEDFKLLKKTYKEVEKVNKKTKDLKDNISKTITKLEENSIETGHYYVQVLDYLREIAHSITFIIKPSYDHVDNNHKALLPVQIEELTELTGLVKDFVKDMNKIIQSQDYSSLDKAVEKQQTILKFIDSSRKKQVKRIKANEVGTRNSMLFLSILAESKSLLLQLINLLKSYRDFTDYLDENNEDNTF
ncbi:MAG: inorganic phosphate transporter [Bacteroidetes bacterium]|nr:inorganic phosphate transporter [Bacteroidota bacterium]MBL7104870.1 inorganic phosphate transporter [Bacteroidales bacterium]